MKTKEAHFLALDGIRGLAALLVLGLHLFFGSMYAYLTFTPLGHWTGAVYLIGEITRYGWGGVDLFFVLSGFLITRILRESIHEPGAMAKFYRRRAARIFPLYYLVLFIVSFAGMSTSFLVLSTLFLTNLLALSPALISYGIVWSLSVEMQFYLFWPMVVRHFAKKQITWVALAILILCPLLRELCIDRFPDFPYGWLRMDGMAWGAVLALVTEGAAQARKLTWLSFSAMGVGVAVFIAALLTGDRISAGHLFAFDVIAFQVFSFGLVAYGLMCKDTSPFAWRFPRLLGQISYGVYLIHPALMMFWDRFVASNQWLRLIHSEFALICIRASFVASLTLVLAYLSFFYFEKPLGRWIMNRGPSRLLLLNASRKRYAFASSQNNL
jgi:peptidoglycan/LPS O-acetylase OafA/YrhL